MVLVSIGMLYVMSVLSSGCLGYLGRYGTKHRFHHESDHSDARRFVGVAAWAVGGCCVFVYVYLLIQVVVASNAISGAILAVGLVISTCMWRLGAYVGRRHRTRNRKSAIAQS